MLALQRRLSAQGFWLGTPDGHFGMLTQQAVYAAQKSAGADRDGVVGARTRAVLERGDLRPVARLARNGVEIDLERQLLLVVRGGRTQWAINTSTASGERYVVKGDVRRATTPKGTFTVYREVDQLHTSDLGELWRPRFFHLGWAVHGAQFVPPWPASHGCARVSNPAMDFIWSSKAMPMGGTVLVR